MMNQAKVSYKENDVMCSLFSCQKSNKISLTFVNLCVKNENRYFWIRLSTCPIQVCSCTCFSAFSDSPWFCGWWCVVSNLVYVVSNIGGQNLKQPLWSLKSLNWKITHFFPSSSVLVIASSCACAVHISVVECFHIIESSPWFYERAVVVVGQSL